MESLSQVKKSVGQEVYILRTSITTQHDVNKIAWYFDTHQSILRWSIDLLDWERVMKLVVTDDFDRLELERFLNSMGYFVGDLAETNS